MAYTVHVYTPSAVLVPYECAAALHVPQAYPRLESYEKGFKNNLNYEEYYRYGIVRANILNPISLVAFILPHPAFACVPVSILWKLYGGNEQFESAPAAKDTCRNGLKHGIVDGFAGLNCVPWMG